MCLLCRNGFQQFLDSQLHCHLRRHLLYQDCRANLHLRHYQHLRRCYLCHRRKQFQRRHLVGFSRPVLIWVDSREAAHKTTSDGALVIIREAVLVGRLSQHEEWAGLSEERARSTACSMHFEPQRLFRKELR